MNEAERLAYLEVMGIESYVPRRVLPGAKPSQLQEGNVVVAESPVEKSAEKTTRSGSPVSLTIIGVPTRSQNQLFPCVRCWAK